MSMISPYESEDDIEESTLDDRHWIIRADSIADRSGGSSPRYHNCKSGKRMEEELERSWRLRRSLSSMIGDEEEADDSDDGRKMVLRRTWSAKTNVRKFMSNVMGLEELKAARDLGLEPPVTCAVDENLAIDIDFPIPKLTCSDSDGDEDDPAAMKARLKQWAQAVVFAATAASVLTT